MKKLLALILALALALAVASCSNPASETPDNSETPASGETPAAGNETTPAAEGGDRLLGLAWNDLSIQFYSDLAALVESQAEEDGIETVLFSADFNVQNQIDQLENMLTMGVTDIVIIPVDQEALKDTMKQVIDAGVNVHSFAYDFGGDNSYYTTATVADQYAIGQAMGEAANEYIENTWPDAADGEVKVAMITLPTSTDDIKRDDGVRDTISANPKAEIVYEYEAPSQDSVESQNAVDMILMQNPDVDMIVCHFASMAIAADERALQHPELDKDTFAIISGDTDDALNARIISSLEGESFIRATGTYSPELELIYEVLMGEHDDELDDCGRYAFGVFKLNAEEMVEFVGG